MNDAILETLLRIEDLLQVIIGKMDDISEIRSSVENISVELGSTKATG